MYLMKTGDNIIHNLENGVTYTRLGLGATDGQRIECNGNNPSTEDRYATWIAYQGDDALIARIWQHLESLCKFDATLPE